VHKKTGCLRVNFRITYNQTPAISRPLKFQQSDSYALISTRTHAHSSTRRHAHAHNTLVCTSWTRQRICIATLLLVVDTLDKRVYSSADVNTHTQRIKSTMWVAVHKSPTNP